jgi:hypothetical protein
MVVGGRRREEERKQWERKSWGRKGGRVEAWKRGRRNPAEGFWGLCPDFLAQTGRSTKAFKHCQ